MVVTLPSIRTGKFEKCFVLCNKLDYYGSKLILDTTAEETQTEIRNMLSVFTAPTTASIIVMRSELQATK